MGKSNFKGCIDAPPHIFLQLTPSGKAQKISTRTTEHCQSPSWGCWGAGWIEGKGRNQDQGWGCVDDKRDRIEKRDINFFMNN